MSTRPQSLPELNERLLQQRGAMVDTVSALRHRIRVRARRLEPQRLLQRHPGAAMISAVMLGLVVGRIAGSIAGSLLRS